MNATVITTMMRHGWMKSYVRIVKNAEHVSGVGDGTRARLLAPAA